MRVKITVENGEKGRHYEFPHNQSYNIQDINTVFVY